MTPKQTEIIKNMDIDELWQIYRAFVKRACQITDFSSVRTPDFLDWLEQEQEKLKQYVQKSENTADTN